MERSRTYFVADVHLGLKAKGPEDREARFLQWLRSIRNPQTKSLWLLGDIWDFWYEYRDVIPREAARVTAQLMGMVEDGIEVYYVPGNHDIWLYSFWQEAGVKVLSQPQTVRIDGKTLLLGHGDALGGAKWNYRLMLKVFHSRVCQALFNLLHPWLAFRMGNEWSNSNRRSHGGYKFRGEAEPLYKFCSEFRTAEGLAPDLCIFGHFHDSVDMALPAGGRLVVLKDWIGDELPHFACLENGELSVR